MTIRTLIILLPLCCALASEADGPQTDPLTAEQIAEAERTADQIIDEWKALREAERLPEEEEKLYKRFLFDTRLLLTRTRQSLEDDRPAMAVRYFIVARKIFAKIPAAAGPKLGELYVDADADLLAVARSLLADGVLGDDDAEPDADTVIDPALPVGEDPGGAGDDGIPERSDPPASGADSGSSRL